MRLAGLFLENFKPFAAPTWVPMAPITLLFGENSAGKSSIVQSLLLLKQSMVRTEPGRTVLLPRGDLVDLGSIRELLYGHDSERTCEISPVVCGKEFEYSKYFWPFPENAVGVGVRFGWGIEAGREELVISGFPVYWGEDEAPLFSLRRTPDRSQVLQSWMTEESGGRPMRVLAHSKAEYLYVPEVPTDPHPAFRALYREFTDEWPKVAQALREWPALESIKSWQWYEGADGESQIYRDNDELSAQEYLTSLIERFRRQGRDLVAELLAKYEDYSYPKFMEDVELRSRRAFRICGFFPHLPTVPLPGESDWVTVDENEQEAFSEPQAPLPSLDGVAGALLTLMNDPNGLNEESKDDVLLPNLCSITAEAQALSQSVLQGMAYVGPLRARPSRHYLYSGLYWPVMDASGANLAEILFDNESVLADVNEALRVLQAEYQVSVVRPAEADAQGLFWLRLTDTRTGVSVSPLDVGVGVGQVLPIVTQLLLARSQILLFEQPELHLHPRLQAELGSLFAKAIHDPYQNQLVIETHSEYIVYRLQKLIKLGQLRPEDVSVVYVFKDEGGSHCVRLRLDEDGDFLDAWPGGFFDTGFDEIFGLK